MKYIKKQFENYDIELDGEIIETGNKVLYDAFDMSKIDTKIVVDLGFYVEKGLFVVVVFCVNNNISINKNIIDDLVIRIKNHTEENILYKDNEYIEWEYEYEWIENDLIELLKDHLPEEYDKYSKHKKAKKFNI